MDISCAFATSSDPPAHVQVAETPGDRRAWLYDSPALYPDVWMVLSRCAERTSRIGLGPGVLVPSLRHPMVNAAAIAELVGQAPGRVAVATGRRLRPLPEGSPCRRDRDVGWGDYPHAAPARLRGGTTD